jgi:3-deoxy-D-manno-octulosonic-acid transferase
MSVPRLVYTLLLILAAPALLLRLAWRARRQPAYLRHVGERFGCYGPHPPKPLLWIHAVSVGETRASAPLIQALQRRFPEHQLLLTHMTPTGRETSEQLFGDTVLRCYLPYDYPFAVRRFLARFRPQLGVLMETEVWPNLIAGCGARQVPLALANARLSEKSARAYGRAGALAREAFSRLSLVCAQSEDDARRLHALNAENVVVTGNIKFDIAPPPSQPADSAALRQLLGAQRSILLAASTREGEESLLLEAFVTSPAPRPLLVIVPRHPQRFEEVAALIAQRGLRHQRRSANEAVHPDSEVVLGDSMGEMFAYYGAADLALIGGSLLPYGGQNLIEACAVGTPVLVGPHTYNFAQASELAVACGAARRVPDAAAALQEAAILLADPASRQRMGDAARAFWRANRGATERTVEALSRLVAGIHQT